MGELELDVARLRGQLGKKSSFISAAQELEVHIASHYSKDGSRPLGKAASCWPLVERVGTLLRTRYTGDNYWRVGQQLFRTCQASIGDPQCLSKLEEYLSSCEEALDEDEGAESQEPAAARGASQQRTGFLFEGQLSSEEEAARARGPIGVPEALMAQLFAAAAGANDEGNINGEAAGAPTQPDPAQLQALIQQQIDDGTHDALIQEILAVSAEQAQQQPAGPPPASKKVVASLPVETVTESRLEELGGKGVECSVCRENIVVGEEVQRMPCSHVFHPPCLKPWLDQHNSCPLCRHELPTDDWRYEDRKEREKEEAETEAGRRNALSHSEFQYL